MTVVLSAIEELAKRPQWVVWKIENGGGKPTKVPYDPTSGQHASVADPTTWADYPTAVGACSEGCSSGVGFVLTRGDPYTAVDLDSCRNLLTGEIAAWAKKIIDAMQSYTEISPSGTGVHIFVKGRVPGSRNRTGVADSDAMRFVREGDPKKPGIEVYDSGRYMTVTGQHFAGTPTTIEARQPQLDTLYRELFGASEPEPRSTRLSRKELRTLEPIDLAGVVSTADEEQVLRKAKQARNGDKFCDLWEGRWQLYVEYPSQSEADLALCRMLAYWTDGDASQVDRLFRRSALFRPKWDRALGTGTYGQQTIALAIGGR
jgi:putative DNA primase/helicase